MDTKHTPLQQLKLKPCPFCGCDAKFFGFDDAVCGVSCTNCAARLPQVNEFAKDARIAIFNWNRRTRTY